VYLARGSFLLTAFRQRPFAPIETTVLSRLETDARPRRQRRLCGYVVERHHLTGWKCSAVPGESYSDVILRLAKGEGGEE
jgi:hypothetical protein